MSSEAPASSAFVLENSTVCVMGARGLLGAQLCAALAAEGARVCAYSRSHTSGDEFQAYWDPARGEIDMGPLTQARAVVNLAGEPLAPGRWTDARKQLFYDSRVRSTRLLCERLAALSQPPEVLVNASAIGFYGDRKEEACSEESPAGEGFLAGLCEAWEDATQPARDAGIRVVRARFGMVLSTQGGALAKMLPAFRMGVGGPIGSGRQYLSWVAIGDAVRAVCFALGCESLSGPVNVVAPESARNEEFAAALGRVLNRPARVRAPAFAVRAALGREAADELLLGGCNVRPLALEHAGFRFDAPRLEDALRAVLEEGN